MVVSFAVFVLMFPAPNFILLKTSKNYANNAEGNSNRNYDPQNQRDYVYGGYTSTKIARSGVDYNSVRIGLILELSSTEGI